MSSGITKFRVVNRWVTENSHHRVGFFVTLSRNLIYRAAMKWRVLLE